MAVGGEDDILDARNAGKDVAEHLRVVLREAVADRVGQVQGGCAGLDRNLANLAQEIAIGAGGVLGRELDVVAVALGQRDHRGDLFERLLASDLQLGCEVKV